MNQTVARLLDPPMTSALQAAVIRALQESGEFSGLIAKLVEDERVKNMHLQHRKEMDAEIAKRVALEQDLAKERGSAAAAMKTAESERASRMASEARAAESGGQLTALRTQYDHECDMRERSEKGLALAQAKIAEISGQLAAAKAEAQALRNEAARRVTPKPTGFEVSITGRDSKGGIATLSINPK